MVAMKWSDVQCVYRSSGSILAKRVLIEMPPAAVMPEPHVPRPDKNSEVEIVDAAKRGSNRRVGREHALAQAPLQKQRDFPRGRCGRRKRERSGRIISRARGRRPHVLVKGVSLEAEAEGKLRLHCRTEGIALHFEVDGTEESVADIDSLRVRNRG